MPSSSKAKLTPRTRFICFICFLELPFCTLPLSLHSSKRVQLTHSLPSPQPSTPHHPASWKRWMVILRFPTFHLPSNSFIRSLKCNINASPLTGCLSGFSCYWSLLVKPFPSLPRYCGLNAVSLALASPIPLPHRWHGPTAHLNLVTPNSSQLPPMWVCLP